MQQAVNYFLLSLPIGLASQLEETFAVSLTTAGLPANFAANIIAPSMVMIAVPKNDDANGVISFTTATNIICKYIQL